MSPARVEPVVRQPRASLRLRRGIDQLAGLIAPTLGPRPRLVAIHPRLSGAAPEILDNGGLIARRLLELPDRDEDMGAMFLRNLLWRLHEQVGDGTATAAVLFRALYDQGVRYTAPGGNAMRLRRFLEAGGDVVLAELARMTTAVAGEEQLARVAQTICHDPCLARLLGEVFDVVGEHGQVEVRSGPNRHHECDYVEGAYWEAPVLSRYMLTDEPDRRVELAQATILISDLAIVEPGELVPALAAARRDNAGALVVVADKLSEAALGLLVANSERSGFTAIAVRTPGVATAERAAALDDLAVLTGGRAFRAAAGDALTTLAPGDLGRVRRAWADRRYLGIIGGKGDPRQVRAHARQLRARYEGTADNEARQTIQRRISRLIGASAVLQIGGDSARAIAARKELAQRTCRAMRGALSEGVLPGGGAALLACRAPLRARLDQAAEPEERAAYRILLRAIEEPLRTIAGNAGYDAGPILAAIDRCGPGYGLDATTGRVVDVAAAGILDPAAVQRQAVASAIRGAALALTIDVLVHPAKPEEAINP